MDVKRLVPMFFSPGGSVFPAASVLIEQLHFRRDRSRPGDVYATGNEVHRKDSVMDTIVTSVLKQSCLTHAAKGSDYVLCAAEFVKFRKDARSSGPIQSSATRRLIPLALNHLGLRGGHFQAMIKEFATILVTRSCGCSLLQGRFALSINGALHKILNTWGSRLTWIAQREHVAQIVGAMDAFYAGAHFLSVLDQRAA
jgi:hypothetical protein